MHNRFTSLMAKKSDKELLTIAQERHRYELDAYTAAIEELERRNIATPEHIEEKKDNIEEFKEWQEAEKVAAQPRERWKRTVALFKITNEYVYTPLLIYANVFIWVVMVLAGVGVLLPTTQSLLDWGGNLSSKTLYGQPWRLLTSTFLHAGIVHLALNMFALVQVGGLLETHFGKHRFAVVYLVTGILASITSLAFNDNVVSVGASGAIFGLYGLLLALLFTKSLQITPEERNELTGSTVIFICYNVFYGLRNSGTDNAAHIGGLLSGFIIGLLYYPFLRKQTNSLVLSILLVVAAIAASWTAPLVITSPYAQFNSVIDKFSRNEEKALLMYGQFDLPRITGEAKLFQMRLKTEGIDLWRENIDLLNTLENMPEDLRQRVDLLKKYCELRIESLEILQARTENETDELINRFEEKVNEINAMIETIEALNTDS